MFNVEQIIENRNDIYENLTHIKGKPCAECVEFVANHYSDMQALLSLMEGECKMVGNIISSKMMSSMSHDYCLAKGIDDKDVLGVVKEGVRIAEMITNHIEQEMKL